MSRYIPLDPTAPAICCPEPIRLRPGRRGSPPGLQRASVRAAPREGRGASMAGGSRPARVGTATAAAGRQARHREDRRAPGPGPSPSGLCAAGGGGGAVVRVGVGKGTGIPPRGVGSRGPPSPVPRHGLTGGGASRHRPAACGPATMCHARKKKRARGGGGERGWPARATNDRRDRPAAPPAVAWGTRCPSAKPRRPVAAARSSAGRSRPPGLPPSRLQTGGRCPSAPSSRLSRILPCAKSLRMRIQGPPARATSGSPRPAATRRPAATPASPCISLSITPRTSLSLQ